jgi:hypothetical protein
MKKFFFCPCLLIFIIFSFIFPALTSSAEKNIRKIQGTVTAVDFKQHTLVVYEKAFVWNANTVFKNERELPVKADQLKPKSWVYIEGEYDKTQQRTVAKKIYLLPKKIDRKEWPLYPFINLD